MGRNTVAALIARGKNRNDYNNSGIDTDGKWVDAFNAALQDLAIDINLTGQLTISYVSGTSQYDLPDDFIELRELRDGFSCPITKRRYYDQNSFFRFPQGYFILFNGTNYVIDISDFNANQTLSGIYTRYPAALDPTNTTQIPEIPTIGEDALIDYAVMISLRNNNQLGQASSVQQEYETGRKKIRDAAARAALGW